MADMFKLDPPYFSLFWRQNRLHSTNQKMIRGGGGSAVPSKSINIILGIINIFQRLNGFLTRNAILFCLKIKIINLTDTQHIYKICINEKKGYLTKI